MTAAAETGTRPFSDALVVEPAGRDLYRAVLGTLWNAAGGKVHGGLMLALLTRTVLHRVDEARAEGGADGPPAEPLVVAADFLRAPDPGPVEIHTDVVKLGRTASVCHARLLQDGRPMLTASVTTGRLPDDPPRWTAGLPDMPALPTATAADPSRDHRGPGRTLAKACEMRFDPADMPFAKGETGDATMRGWVRPRGEEPDVLFALLAGDILPPTVFNLGGTVGWAPTVQLTALLRGRPSPGWLRCASTSHTVAGTWFDEDASVVDESGRLICQARQLALAPLPR
ncbi:acyl-CoA thioesterase [Pseudonocardia dioxanivorans]|uniref:Aromatic compounds degradation protein PaaI n=1 Tax=Pseudonocardia dioxanivorans (strain ATCC 55486 / DSM 44775 / JCM 13855 / CB1190) TaxID=675635 RepID=F4CZT5_PSEUX|nr:thioesterase family protein [Pseudonocardia dioxanivorans]AEA27761.1 aromatic compounds degradation protein PaaI [Pseudonocardia dioxanivorans CB1190]